MVTYSATNCYNSSCSNSWDHSALQTETHHLLLCRQAEVASIASDKLRKNSNPPPLFALHGTRVPSKLVAMAIVPPLGMCLVTFMAMVALTFAIMAMALAFAIVAVALPFAIVAMVSTAVAIVAVAMLLVPVALMAVALALMAVAFALALMAMTFALALMAVAVPVRVPPMCIMSVPMTLPLLGDGLRSKSLLHVQLCALCERFWDLIFAKA